MLEQLQYDHELSLNPLKLNCYFDQGRHLKSLPSADGGFEYTKPYQYGDSTKSIDQRILARTDQLIVRQSHPDSHNLPVEILVDASDSMCWPGHKLVKHHKLTSRSKFQSAMKIAINIAYNLIKHNETVVISMVVYAHNSIKIYPAVLKFRSELDRLIAITSINHKNYDRYMYLSWLKKTFIEIANEHHNRINHLRKNNSISRLLFENLDISSDSKSCAHTIMISDLISPVAHSLWNKIRGFSNLIVLLSILELDLSWLKPSCLYRPLTQDKNYDHKSSQQTISSYYSKAKLNKDYYRCLSKRLVDLVDHNNRFNSNHHYTLSNYDQFLYQLSTFYLDSFDNSSKKRSKAIKGHIEFLHTQSHLDMYQTSLLRIL